MVPELPELVSLYLLPAEVFSVEPFAKHRFSIKIKACEKFYHRHMIDIPRIKFCA
jgi:hypothetical protein